VKVLLDALIVLLAALIILAKSAEVVIKNAVVIARFLHVSELAIGFILISVATSLPELVVSIFASLDNQTGIVVGNVFGSNIADIALVLGVGAIIAKTSLKPKKKQAVTLAQILLVTSLLPLAMLLGGFATRWFGIVLLLVFVAFAYFLLKREVAMEKLENKVTSREALGAFVLFFMSVCFVVLSARFAVDNAVRIAELFGVTKTFIGATLIALGTSLPELAVDIAAIRKGKASLAFGDVLGSCITNLTLVLGVGVVINPYIISNITTFFTLIAFALIANIVISYFLQTQLTYKEGIVLLAIYFIFIAATLTAEIGLY
jgi:cation:H+ antiporter